MTILLADAEATERFGRTLAPLLRAGDVVALFGALVRADDARTRRACRGRLRG